MTSSGAGPILLLSDLHAHYHVVNEQIAHAEASTECEVDQAVVLGDFGLFSTNLHDHFRRKGRRFTRPTSFIEGNHEDFRNLESLVADYADVVSYLPRGAVKKMGPWRWLCIGGARYMDAWSTPSGCEIEEGDIADCLSHARGDVDIVISHDCPTGIGVISNPELGHLGNPGVPGLARVAEHLEPGLWFFGHHHRWHRTEVNGTVFQGLPQSWEGYVLLNPEGGVRQMENRVQLPGRPGWLKWIGLK